MTLIRLKYLKDNLGYEHDLDGDAWKQRYVSVYHGQVVA